MGEGRSQHECGERIQDDYGYHDHDHDYDNHDEHDDEHDDDHDDDPDDHVDDDGEWSQHVDMQMKPPTERDYGNVFDAGEEEEEPVCFSCTLLQGQQPSSQAPSSSSSKNSRYF